MKDRINNQLFLSYGSPDKAFVRKLAADLKAVGIEVWLDEYEIKVGDSISAAVNQAISRSAYFVALISDDSVKRPWVQKELQTAMHLQIEGKLKILPALITNSEDIPPFIRELRYADFTGAYQIGVRDLVMAVDPTKAERVCILRRDLGAAEKISWFLTDFSLDYVKQTSNIRRRYYTESSAVNTDLFKSILTELNEEWEHLNRTERYSFNGVGSPKSAVAYIRDYLEAETVDPFKDIYDPIISDGADKKFKKLFLVGNSQFESFLFKYVKAKFDFLIKVNPAFSFTNENLQLSIVDRIVAAFERYCCFECAAERA